MSCVPAPACKALLLQASARWPRRSRASDGICPSPLHTKANPTSDHELGNAADLTHHPAGGCDAHAWADDLRRRQDPRVKYVISRGRIASSYAVGDWAQWAWRPYTGDNPHDSHVHVSIWASDRDDTSRWFVDPPVPSPVPTPSPIHLTPPEDDMFIAWDPDAAYLVFRDATGRLVRTYVGDPVEVVAVETALQGGKRLVAPKLLERIPVA